MTFCINSYLAFSYKGMQNLYIYIYIINTIYIYIISNQYYVRSVHRAAVLQHSSNWNNKIIHNSVEHFLCNPSDFFSDDVLSCLQDIQVFFSRFKMRWCLISQTEHLNTSGITSHGTDSFHIKLITPGYPIPKISTCLTIF